MQANRIEVGMILQIKREVLESSCHADGTPFEGNIAKVTAIKYREGYKTPWIMCGDDAFRPSDFSRLIDYAY